MNKVHLIGNLTNEPTLRYTQQNTAEAKYSIAVNTGYGEKKETLFMNVITWGKSAEFVSQYITKGQTVAITGRLKDNSYEDDEGNKHNLIIVITEEIEAIGNRRQQNSTKEERIEETKQQEANKEQTENIEMSEEEQHNMFDLTDEDLPF